MNIRQIEYLDLEIQSSSRYIRNINKNYKFSCYFQSDSQQHLVHDLHGDQPMLNTLVDLIITLGSKLELTDKASNQILVNIRDKIFKLEEKLDNLEYIKNQNNDIYARIREFRSLELKPKYNINQQKILDQIGERIEPLQELLKEIKQLIIS